MSIMHDLSFGSPGMDQATDLLKADGNMALGWAKTLSSKRDKPLIRCENCTKTLEEIGGNPKFMVCSTCRSKLDFVVHYCSQ
jgi:protein-arginine kinase activator protein McsA